MRIQNNIMALNTHRFYTNNNNAVSKAAEKLSSGYRINRAGDDAAGLAISEKLRAQVRGLNMAKKNSQDAVSLVQTAEGALQEVHSMLQRMNELANQSASGTNDSGVDRAALQQEFQNLQDEIDQIAATTTFNDMKIMDGTYESGAEAAEVTATIKVDPDKAVTQTGDTMEVSIGGEKITLTATKYEDEVVWSSGNTTSWSVKLEQKAENSYDLTATALAKEESALDAAPTITMTYSQDGATVANAAALDGDAALDKGADPSKFGIIIQTGAETAQTLAIFVEDMNTTGLNLTKADVKIDTQSAAAKAITSTRKAINIVSTQRAELGAMQNRLEYKINNLANTAENLTASESRIRDLDMASEMTNFTKNNILSQAATAMLAQGNALPQNVLSLLG